VGVVAYRLGRARADGVPAVNPLYYGGVLSDGGSPVEGARNVTVRLWDAATAGATVCTTTTAGTTFTSGRFRVALDAACVGAVRANPELWAEVQVEGTTFPRSKLGAVPYALEAGRATAAAGALEARIAAVEARAIGQFVINPWRRPAPDEPELRPIPCPVSVPTSATWIALAGSPFSLSFTASASGFYRIHLPNVSVYDGTASYQTRVVGVPASEFEVFGERAYVLEAGRAYSFSMEVQIGPSCRPLTAQIQSSFVVQQLN